MSSQEYENVYTVMDYWDGILKGIADFHGAPYYYERPFNEELDDYTDYFLLKPIDDETFNLAMEDWAIWQRWYAAKIPDHHPALPVDRPRHTEIQLILNERLVIDGASKTKAIAKFEMSDEDIDPKHPSNPFAKIQVKWSILPGFAVE